jgi:hypothetical protein
MAARIGGAGGRGGGGAAGSARVLDRPLAGVSVVAARREREGSSNEFFSQRKQKKNRKVCSGDQFLTGLVSRALFWPR